MALSEAWGNVLGGLTGGLLGMGSSALSAGLSFDQTKELQQRQFDYQKKMSNTAYQRAVKDMRKAGINPILAGMSQTGASTPSGAMGQGTNVNLGEGMTNGIATALQVKRNEADIKLIDEQAKTEEKRRENFEANTFLQNSERVLNEIESQFRGTKLEKEIENVMSNTKLNIANAAAAYINSSANQITANANRLNAETAKTSSLTRWAHDAGKRHLESFKKDHPILSTTPLYKHIRNYFE